MKFRGETVLLYHLNTGDRYRKLQGVFIRMGLKCRVIEESQVDWSIGSLFRLPGYTQPEQEAQPNQLEMQENSEPVKGQMVPEGEVLLMNGFSSRRLDELLKTMAKAGVGKIPLKAIVTADNAKWTFRALYEELCQEHEKMEEYKNQI